MLKQEIIDFLHLRISEVPSKMKNLVQWRFSENPLTKCDNSPLEHTILIETNCCLDENVDIFVQKEIPVEDLLARVDFLIIDRLSGQKFIIECDSREWHSNNPDKVESDKVRDTLLTSAGYIVLRFIGRDIYHRSKWCLKNIENTIELYREKLPTIRSINIGNKIIELDPDSILYLKYFSENYLAHRKPGKKESPKGPEENCETDGDNKNPGINFITSGKWDWNDAIIQNFKSVLNYLASISRNFTGTYQVVLEERTPGYIALGKESAGNTGENEFILIHPEIISQEASRIKYLFLLILVYPLFRRNTKNKNDLTLDNFRDFIIKTSGLNLIRICPFCGFEQKTETGNCPVCRKPLL